jgi:ABC-type multidrug transport system ATPase subunit
MDLAIRTDGLTRRYPNGSGVEDLAIEVPQGSIYAFLGPNGAGKTTTIRLLLGLLRPQRGTVLLFGASGPLRRIGALVEAPSLYPHLSGRDNLEVTRRLFSVAKPRVDAVLARVGLGAVAGRRVREYSLGMRQRLGLALALLGEPRLLVLDEPANGLDPAGTVDFRALLRSLCVDDGITVFLSSHLLAEVEQVATHVGLLDGGRLRFQGTLAALRAQGAPRLRLRCAPIERAGAVLASLGIAARVEGDALWLDPPSLDAAVVNRHLVEAGIAVSELAPEPVTLEQIFLRLTGDRHAVAA